MRERLDPGLAYSFVLLLPIPLNQRRVAMARKNPSCAWTMAGWVHMAEVVAEFFGLIVELYGLEGA